MSDNPMREQVSFGVSGVEFIDTQNRCAGETSTPRPKCLKSLSGAPAGKADNQRSQADAIEPPRRSNDRPHSKAHRLPQQEMK
jgi:hypothetical protein